MDIQLIKMVRSEEAAAGGPLTADVHPDEVANYTRAGFVVPEDAVIVPGKPTKAAELIELIMKAETAAQVDELLGSDARATVVAAAAARKAELEKAE
jgi:hypothetical protein